MEFNNGKFIADLEEQDILIDPSLPKYHELIHDIRTATLTNFGQGRVFTVTGYGSTSEIDFSAEVMHHTAIDEGIDSFTTEEFFATGGTFTATSTRNSTLFGYDPLSEILSSTSSLEDDEDKIALLRSKELTKLSITEKRLLLLTMHNPARVLVTENPILGRLLPNAYSYSKGAFYKNLL